MAFACDVGTSSDDAFAVFAVRDSAGVAVVTNRGPDAPLALREVLRVGIVDGDPNYLFQAIRGVAPDPAGGIWVVDRNERVRHYDASGRYTRAVGGRGDGPGESQLYFSATPNGDRLLLHGVPGVFQLFDGTGALIAEAGAGPGRIGLAAAGSADGEWVMMQHGYMPPAGQTTSTPVYRGTTTFARSADLQALDTIRTFPGGLLRLAGQGHVGSGPWLQGNPAFAVDGRGNILVADTLGYRIESWGLDGRLLRMTGRTVEPRAFDRAWLDELEPGFVSAQRSTAPGRAGIDRDELARQVAAATPDPVPTHLSAIEAILAGPDGVLWVERADLHPRPALRAVAHYYGYIRHAWLPEWAAPRVYDVFDADGRYTGSVELPDNIAPLAVAGDRMYGVLYDQLDVEYVVVYEIGSR